MRWRKSSRLMGVSGPSTQTKSVPRSPRPPAPYGMRRVDLLPSSPRTTRARRPSPSSLRRLREATSSDLPSLFGGKTHASLKSYAELADSVHLVLVSNRWVDQERWEWYILNVIVSSCEGHPAAFVVDSHAPHISPESIALGRKHAASRPSRCRRVRRGSCNQTMWECMVQ